MKEIKVRVCVGAVLIRVLDHGRDESALVLLGRWVANREFYPDVWDVLGGHLEPGEASEQALVRELREEIGVTPTAWASLGKFRDSLPGGNGSIVLHSEVSWFAVKDAYRLAHPSYPEILCRAASIASSAGRTGSVASTIASSGRLEDRSVAAHRAP